jgi:hypothetical protein
MIICTAITNPTDMKTEQDGISGITFLSQIQCYSSPTDETYQTCGEGCTGSNYFLAQVGLITFGSIYRQLLVIMRCLTSGAFYIAQPETL